MANAKDVIKDLRAAGDFNVDDRKLKCNSRVKSSSYIHWDNSVVGGVETYYEVYNPSDDLLWVQFHAKVSKCSWLMKIPEGLTLFGGSKTYGQFMCGLAIHVSGLGKEAAVEEVKAKLLKVYSAVEPCRGKGSCRKDEDGKAVDKHRDGIPLLEVASRTGIVSSEEYDKGFLRLIERGVIRWLPWVGQGYSQTRMLVIGESNYSDRESVESVEDAIARVNNERTFTRRMVRLFCIDGACVNRTFDGVTRLLEPVENSCVGISASQRVWSNVTYFDLLQGALRGFGWGQDSRARPREGRSVQECRQFWSEGREAMFNLVRLLSPRAVLVVGGETARNMIGKSGHLECRTVCEGKRVSARNGAAKIWQMEIVNGETGQQIPVIGVPNTSGNVPGFAKRAQLSIKPWLKLQLGLGRDWDLLCRE